MNKKKIRKIVFSADLVSKILLGVAALVLLLTVFLIMTEIEGASVGGDIYRLQNPGLSLKEGDYLVSSGKIVSAGSGDAVVFISEETETAGLVSVGTFSSATVEGEEKVFKITTDNGEETIYESSYLGLLYKKAPLMTLTVGIVSSALFYIFLIVLPGAVVIFRIVYGKKKFGTLTSDQIARIDSLGLDPEDAELQRLVSLYGEEILDSIKTKN